MIGELQARIDAGDLPGARSICEQRISAMPDDVDAHRHLGQLLAASGDWDAARRSARRACALAPTDSRVWSDFGLIQARAGRLHEATDSFERAVHADPRCADAWHNLGTALKQLGERAAAFSALRKALEIDPSRADSYLNLGNLLVEADQFEDAVIAFERAAQHDPHMARARSRLAQALSRRGKVRRAESLFRQALALDPERVQDWFGLGRTLEDLGIAEAALNCYRKVLERAPGHAPVLGQYLALTPDDAPEAVLASAMSRLEAGPDEARALIAYGLAKYHDRRRDFAQAARFGRMANEARRRRAGVLDRDRLRARVDAIVANCDAGFLAQRRYFGASTDEAVFIVGMPRSGTTLTEAILAAHPLVHGAGELPELARIASEIDEGEPGWRAALRMNEFDSRVRAQAYLRALREGAEPGCLRLIDKSPLNFFLLALAALLLPGARVLHCCREPRDNALSIWMENFNADQRYATDFSDLACYLAEYRRLMRHWRAVLPLPLHELRYEDTVADVAAQARRLTDALDLPWDARCLDFHRSARAVQTPSRWQVRQPVYAASVGRWESYAAHLPELLAAFPSGLPDGL